MKTNKQLLSIANEILEQMYEEADPPIDYHRVKDYREHVLDGGRQREIAEAIFRRKKGLSKKDITTIGFHVFNVSPLTVVDLEE